MSTPAKDKSCFGFDVCMYGCMYGFLFFNMRSCCGSWSCASLQIEPLRVSNSGAVQRPPPVILQRLHVLYWFLCCINRSQLCLSIFSCLCRYVVRMGMTVFKLYVSKLNLEFHVGHIFMVYWPFISLRFIFCSIMHILIVIFLI